MSVHDRLEQWQDLDFEETAVLCKDAAAEIARLRRKLAYEIETHNKTCDERDRLRAERDTLFEENGRLAYLSAQNEKLRAALEPFANYADKRHLMPGSMVITNGSSLAKGQLTMGDCYNARKALAKEGK